MTAEEQRASALAEKWARARPEGFNPLAPLVRGWFALLSAIEGVEAEAYPRADVEAARIAADAGALELSAKLLVRVADSDPPHDAVMRWWETVGALERRFGEVEVRLAVFRLAGRLDEVTG